MPFISTALAIGGIAASVGGAAIGASAAGNAADAQAQAAMHAADLQHQDAQAALAFQQQQSALQQKNAQPWITAGQGAVTGLWSDLQNGGYPSWAGQFNAPTGLTEQNDPGFQARLKLGQQALERSAASRGGLLSGGTGRALTQYAQDYASNEYGNVYNRALGEYQQKYGEFQQAQANRFNRYASIAGLGQTATAQSGALGQAGAQNAGNILLTSGQQIGNSYQNAAAARASGYINQANSINAGIGGITGLLPFLLQQQQQQSSGGSTGFTLPPGSLGDLGGYSGP